MAQMWMGCLLLCCTTAFASQRADGDDWSTDHLPTQLQRYELSIPDAATTISEWGKEPRVRKLLNRIFGPDLARVTQDTLPHVLGNNTRLVLLCKGGKAAYLQTDHRLIRVPPVPLPALLEKAREKAAPKMRISKPHSVQLLLPALADLGVQQDGREMLAKIQEEWADELESEVSASSLSLEKEWFGMEDPSAPDDNVKDSETRIEKSRQHWGKIRSRVTKLEVVFAVATLVLAAAWLVTLLATEDHSSLLFDIFEPLVTITGATSAVLALLVAYIDYEDAHENRKRDLIQRQVNAIAVHLGVPFDDAYATEEPYYTDPATAPKKKDAGKGKQKAGSS